MTTVTMNISLTEDLKSFVDSRIKARGYSSASEYMRDLVRRDEERQAEERLKALIEEGIASGPAGEWKDLRAEFLAASGAPLPTLEKPRTERSRKAA
ncbi:MAG: type II toxin-antitoxin system ParD family antitoxin [Burkholderiaceae bacterium]